MCSLVLTHLDYSNAVLVNAPDAITKLFQLVQNFAMKIVLNKRKQDSATECLKELHCLPLKFRCIFKLLMTVYNSLKKKGSIYLQTTAAQHIKSPTNSKELKKHLNSDLRTQAFCN